MIHDIKQDRKIIVSEEKQKVLQETKTEYFWEYIHLLVEVDAQKSENQLDFRRDNYKIILGKKVFFFFFFFF